MRTVSYDFRGFLQGDRTPKNNQQIGFIIKTATAGHMILSFPLMAFAKTGASASAWSKIFTTIFGIADWLCVGVIIFAGATWMFGNRTKAIENLISGAAGYIIIRHALDIRNWLKGL